ncbi:30S ribosome-binding factor RbfA [bacterium]|nr:30S ribosome-binding factor RbfA [bacterium]
MRSTRLRRIDDQIRRVVSEALLSSVQDPRIGFVTVTSVEVSREFDTAKVYVSVLGTEEERQETLKGLRSAAPFLQSRIGKAMRLRRIPLLRFLYDDSLDRGLRVEAVLRGLRPEAADPPLRDAADPGPDQEPEEGDTTDEK